MDSLFFAFIYFAAIVFIIIVKIRKARRQKENRSRMHGRQAGLPYQHDKAALGSFSDRQPRLDTPHDQPRTGSGDDHEDSVIETAWRNFRPPEPDVPEARRPEPAAPVPAAEPPAPVPDVYVETDNATPPQTPARTSAITQTQDLADFSARLKHLSQLQQAIVMAEVLGKPKGLQMNERVV